MSVAALAVAMSVTPLVFGDSIAPPRDSIVRSENGAYVFVSKVEDNLRKWSTRTPETERYPQSGVYPGDGSARPLWVSPLNDVNAEVANDGIHVVVHGPWASDPKQLAVSFYERSKLLAEYAIRDLVAAPEKLPHTVSHFSWERTGKLDNDRMIYTLETLEGARYEFALSTGAIVSRTKPPSSASFQGRVSLRDGSTVSLRGFSVCQGAFYFLDVLRGSGSNTKLRGYREDAANRQLITLVGVPFADIQAAHFLRKMDERKAQWELDTHSQGKVKLILEGADAYCGTDNTGASRRIQVEDMRALELESP